MYVLVHKERVLAGPMGWNRAIFDGNLEKLKIKYSLPRDEPENLPLIIDDDTKIYEARLEYPQYNSKIEYPHGPFWIYSNIAYGTFQIIPIPIELIKNTLKETIAKNRYEKEISGVIVNIQNQNITFSTDREKRKVYYERLLTMVDTSSILWKENGNYILLSKTEMQQITNSISEHIQSLFTWEYNKIMEIDNCTSSDQLDSIVLVP